jgi:hypothetical protein
LRGAEGAGAEDRQRHLRDRGGVAHAAVGDHAGGAADQQAGRRISPAEAARASPRQSITSTLPAGAFSDRLALRVLGIGEDADMVEVLAGGDVAQRVGRADHVAPVIAEAPDTLDVGVAQPALEQLRW